MALYHLVYSHSPTGMPFLLRAAGPRPVSGWKKGRPVAGSIGWSAAYSAARRLASAFSLAACSLHCAHSSSVAFSCEAWAPTTEVLMLQRLERGLQAGHRRASQPLSECCDMCACML